MARTVEEPFEETFPTAKGCLGFAHGRLVEFGNVFHMPGDLDAAATTAMSRLDRHRQAMLLGKGHDFRRRRHRAVAAGNQRRADAGSDPPGLNLVAERFDDMRIRADPDQACIDDGAGKLSPLGQEAVTWMYGVGAGALGDADQLFDVEIGFRRPAAGQPIGLIRQLHEQCVHVRIGIDGNRADAMVAAGADDANGDFATVGNQHFLHGVYPYCLWPAGIASQALAGLISAKAVTGRKRIFALTGICPARSRWYSATVPMTG